jgi:hypothetical protein
MGNAMDFLKQKEKEMKEAKKSAKKKVAVSAPKTTPAPKLEQELSEEVFYCIACGDELKKTFSVGKRTQREQKLGYGKTTMYCVKSSNLDPIKKKLIVRLGYEKYNKLSEECELIGGIAMNKNICHLFRQLELRIILEKNTKALLSVIDKELERYSAIFNDESLRESMTSYCPFRVEKKS